MKNRRIDLAKTILPLPQGLSTKEDEVSYLKNLAEAGLELLKLPPRMLGKLGKKQVNLDAAIESIYLAYCEKLTEEEQELIEETIYRLSTGVSSYEKFNRTPPAFQAADDFMDHEAVLAQATSFTDGPALGSANELAEFNMVLDKIDSFEPSDKAGKQLKEFFLECRDRRDSNLGGEQNHGPCLYEASGTTDEHEELSVLKADTESWEGEGYIEHPDGRREKVKLYTISAKELFEKYLNFPTQ